MVISFFVLCFSMFLFCWLIQVKKKSKWRLNEKDHYLGQTWNADICPLLPEVPPEWQTRKWRFLRRSAAVACPLKWRVSVQREASAERSMGLTRSADSYISTFRQVHGTELSCSVTFWKSTMCCKYSTRTGSRVTMWLFEVWSEGNKMFNLSKAEN